MTVKYTNGRLDQPSYPIFSSIHSPLLIYLLMLGKPFSEVHYELITTNNREATNEEKRQQFTPITLQ